jgi:hypothetical protein
MEFLVVLPVYFLLIGFAFVIGELALHSIHLAASADRSYAMSSVADKDIVFDKVRKAISFDKDEDEEPEYSYEGDGAGSAKVSDFSLNRIDRVGNVDFQGAWTKAVAAHVRDSYTLTPLARGFVAYWFRENERLIEEKMTDNMDVSKDSALYAILGQKGKVGRAEMVGKDLRHNGSVAREYGYYSLQRNDQGRKGFADGRLPYRAWDAGALADSDSESLEDSVWYSKVYAGFTAGSSTLGDRLASSDYDIVDGGNLTGKNAPEKSENVSRSAWTRFDDSGFVREWTDP